jgi:hypothetical protein
MSDVGAALSLAVVPVVVEEDDDDGDDDSSLVLPLRLVAAPLVIVDVAEASPFTAVAVDAGRKAVDLGGCIGTPIFIGTNADTISQYEDSAVTTTAKTSRLVFVMLLLLIESTNYFASGTRSTECKRQRTMVVPQLLGKQEKRGESKEQKGAMVQSLLHTPKHSG